MYLVIIVIILFSGPPRTPDDGWTNLNPDAPVDRDPGLPDRREEELEPLDLDNIELEPLEPITEANNYDPVRELEPRPRLEDDGDWLSSGSQRKPWLPTDFNQDIRPFDDLFSNSLDTYADARTGAGLNIAANTVLVIMVSLYLLLLGA